MVNKQPSMHTLPQYMPWDIQHPHAARQYVPDQHPGQRPISWGEPPSWEPGCRSAPWTAALLPGRATQLRARLQISTLDSGPSPGKSYPAESQAADQQQGSTETGRS
ncbi:unnamed protein product [Boreogadus saida]